MIRPVAFLVMLAPLAAGAAEIGLGPDTRNGLAITIYQDDLGFVRERRSAELPGGTLDLALTGLPDRAVPESARIEAAGLALLEKSFETEILSAQSLLSRALGREVSVVRTDPQTGLDLVERGRVIATHDGPVLEIGGKIHAQPPGRIVFDEVPSGLRATPALVLRATAEQPARREIGLSYLTGGLSWRADYLLDLDPGGDRAALQGWVSVSNQSGADFLGARLAFASGTVQRVHAPVAEMQKQMMVRAPAMAMGAAAPVPSQPEAVGNVQIVSFDRAVDLPAGRAKQLALFAIDGIAAERNHLALDGDFAWGPRTGEQKGFAMTEAVLQASGPLNRPLPAGSMRIYRRDGSGQPQLLGEQAVAHTAPGDKLKLRLGNDPDLPVTRVQTDFKRLAQDTTEAVWEIRLRNAKAEPVTVRVQKILPGDWQIMEETMAHQREDVRTAVWPVRVEAGGEAKVRFRVRTRN